MSDAVAGDPARPRKSSLASAGGSTLAARVVSQIAQLLMFIVAARVLSPAEFGVFTLVGAGSTLLFIVGGAGWREFILGWGGGVRAVHQAVTYSILSGYILAMLGFIAAGVIAAVFQLLEVAWLSLIFSLCVLFSPMSGAYSAILVRKDKVKALAIASIASEIAGLVLGVLLLYRGWGVLALGASKLAAQVIYLALVVFWAQWRLQLLLTGVTVREILGVSREILFMRITGFVGNYASTFIVGLFLGVANVGYFRAAERIVASFSELVSEPLRLVAWMVFRKAADRADTPVRLRHELAGEAAIFFPLLLLISGPIFVGLAVVSPSLIEALLGQSWLPAAPVVSILAISALLLTPAIATEPLLTVAGKIRTFTPFAVLNSAVVVVALFAVTRFGMDAAAWARVAGCGFIFATSVWVQVRHTDAPWWGAIRGSAPIYTALIAMIAAVLAARALAPIAQSPALSQLLIETLAGAIAYFAIILLVRPSYLRTMLWL